MTGHPASGGRRISQARASWAAVLASLDALRDVRFVMKDGMVFKRDGVMTPAEFFHGGPVNGWRIR